VECGKGTYVRALARDLGRDLGCYGYISALRRTMVAPSGKIRWCRLPISSRSKRLRMMLSGWQALDAFLVPAGKRSSACRASIFQSDQAHRLRMGNPIILRGRDAPVATDDACAFNAGACWSPSAK
jgi:tRNA pseudouridine55 synthase